MPRQVVGLISDTHGLVRPQIVRVFDGVSRILHAGDVGGAAVLRALEAIAPGDVVMFGHTHRAILARTNDRIAVNPGAAGPRRFDIQPSVALLTIDGGTPSVRIISLT